MDIDGDSEARIRANTKKDLNLGNADEFACE